MDQIVNKEKGDDDNPRTCRNFQKSFFKDIELLALWSNIRTNYFGHRRIPASEIIKITNRVLNKNMRIDVAVESIIDYYDGRMRMVESSVISRKGAKIIEPLGVLNAETPSLRKRRRARESSMMAKEMSLSMMHLTTNGNKDKMIVQCIACKNNDAPTNAHICLLCTKFIHILPGCSKSVGDNKGFGEIRICMECFQSPKREKRLAAKLNENWKNCRTSPKKKKHITKQNKEKLEQASTSIKYKKLQIFRNGNDDNLSKIKYPKNAQISLRNTCAFDVVFQILLSASTDYESVEKYLTRFKNTVGIFKAVLDTKQNGLTTHSYKLRADLLLDYKNEKPEEGKIKSINCTSNIGNLGRYLFRKTPSFVESFKCSLGCPDRKIELPIFGIKKDILISENFRTIINDCVQRQKPPRCVVPNCKGIEEQLALKVGDIVVFEPYDSGKIKLGSISKWLKNPKEETLFKLAGLVEYTSNKYASGDDAHYKAICLRNQHWLVYDDLKPDKHIRQKDNYRVDVALIIYIKMDT